MREIPKKNYYILAILLIVTVILTLLLSSISLNKEETFSDFYEYSNKIVPEEFDEYMLENNDIIIYISSKYDLSNKTFENRFQKKLNNLNLKENLIFIDKNDINTKFLKKFKKTYGINLNLKKTPIIVVIIDEKVIKKITVSSNTNVDTIIEYEDFR